MKNTQPADIGDVKPISLKAGVSTLLEMPLDDKTNENSCTLTYYEVGLCKGDIKLPLVNRVMMQWLNEPFFDDLRTKQ